MLCSILIPTRFRTARLERTIASVRANAPRATEGVEFEFVTRIDEDDIESQTFLQLRPIIKTVIRDRGKGWFDCSRFYSEAAAASSGQWVWIMNDDCEVHGPWYERLLEIKELAFVQPETYGLGQSKYHECRDIGFPLVPRDSYGPTMPDPIDLGLYKLLVEEKGWPVRFLKNVTVQHDRASDKELEEHRK